MTVVVQGTEPSPTTYPTGADWFIDEEGRLHVRDAAKKHIAAYNHNAWASACSPDETPATRTVTVELKADTSQYLAAINEATVATDALRNRK